MKKEISEAESKVAELEKLPPGSVWKPAHDSAVAAIEELRAVAAAEIFPITITAMGADLFSDLRMQTETLVRENFLAGVVELHRCCLETYPELATALRGKYMRSKIAEMVSSGDVVLQRPAGELASEAIEEFELEVSRQLLERGELLPWSEILGNTIPVLIGRRAAVVVRQKKHATDELERQEKEREKARAILEREADAKQKKLDSDVRKAEAAATKKEKIAVLEQSIALAAKIERLKLKTVELGSRSFYSVPEICGMLRNGSFTRGRVERISASVDRAAEKIKNRVRI